MTKKKSFENIKNWHENILNEWGDDLILGLLGNKIDLPDRQVTTEEGFKKAEEIKALY